MYGFGDDRNPATDTVNVMEEILVEFITDVVRLFRVLHNKEYSGFISVKRRAPRLEKLVYP